MPGQGVYAQLRVVDLTRGVAGGITTMLLADAGAEVIRIDLPGDPFAGLSGYRVWHRGKRRATLDPVSDVDEIRALIATADVLVETFEEAPSGLDAVSLAALNPRLVHCSITGYGDAAAHRGRPAVDSLVAARTGLHWEARGVPGTTIGALSGRVDPLADLETGPVTAVGPDRAGPMFTGIPWASNAAAYLATIAVAGALRAREVCGRGQHVATSLVQGVLCSTAIAWQRAEDPDSESYLGWTTDPRAPKGFYRASDGRWIQQWVQLPSFMLGVSEGDELAVPHRGGVSPKDADLRIATDYTDMVLLHHFHPQMEAAAARFPAADWERVAAEAGVPFEIVRPPEEALLDPALLDDGCVVELPDPDHGAIRAVGSVLHLADCPAPIGTGTVPPGTDTAWVREQASREPEPAPAGTEPVAPLAGVRVLDLGLAIAGPYGAQLLADLGADVIKVNALHDDFWMRTQYSHMSNRGKRSLAIDLKDPRGLAVFYDLVRGADVVHHNMRYGAAKRLKIDFESLREINPRLVYCHTRGYEHGARDAKPANDQTAAALAGTEWVDGAADNGGTPIWPSISLGDTGNGLLSAIAVLQALYHRDRTGRGQFVDTSILYAHLLNASMAWTTPGGAARGDRPVVDADSWGISPLHRIYPAREGWLCLAVLTDDDRQRLAKAVPAAAGATGEALAETLTAAFAADTAEAWGKTLDAHGVPAEVCANAPGTVLFDDPGLKDSGLISAYRHPVTGDMEMAGRLMDFAGSRVPGRPPLIGEHTREILTELGLGDVDVDALLEAGVVRDGAA
ncbi:CoA transferase [Amycolatopsis acidicola]|uniref:CoA transferase n=1 Tax=Amycolatopsis acidicola TaxID=2596893 RepID=A0A5N0UV92_9PSEU|nr:CoA transferase [Amycolatopsis acidicola]KAA9156341.1 CoA transferase [Amycolatopsis acidicola]